MRSSFRKREKTKERGVLFLHQQINYKKMEDNNAGKLITALKAGWLKRSKNLTPQEREELNRYQQAQRPSLDQMKRNLAYTEKMNAPLPRVSYKILPEKLYGAFIESFERTYKKPFLKSEEAMENLKSLLLYFCQDDRFYKCRALSDFTEPSFEKGLLIVGGYGIGKTAMMRVFSRLLPASHGFVSYSAHEAVELYEEIQTPEDKKLFWTKMTRGVRYFDDVKSERAANNYGKANLFKDILEKRYADEKKTYVSCNYAQKSEGDLQKALAEFGALYGPRVYDRLFEMFNVLVFKGKSFRR